jgi:malonate decarboxylase gamma subunit
MSSTTPLSSRGRTWFQALADKAQPVDTGLGSVLVADTTWDGERVRLLAIVPDPQNRFPRARHGELGLDEGWALAHHVREAVAADGALHSPVQNTGSLRSLRSVARRPIIAVVDVQSQAYGRLEALLGIHLSLAAAADAYATARTAGHPVVALIVGTALSGGLLAHGDQAHRLLALDDPQVMVQAMRKESAARVTRRTVEELDELGKTVIPMAYDIRQFAKLGLLHELITEINADSPSAAQIARVKQRVAAAVADIRKNPGDLTSRLNNPEARTHRAASIEVRRRLTEQWNATTGVLQE